MVPIPSQAEGDLCRLEDGAPWTSKERCSTGGGVAHNSWHDFRASGAFVSWSILFQMALIHLSSLFIEYRSIEQFVLDILLFFQYGEELFMSLIWKKPLTLVISLLIIWMEQCQRPCTWNSNPKYCSYLHIVCRCFATNTNGSHVPTWWGNTSSEVGFFQWMHMSNLYWNFVKKWLVFCHFRTMETSQCSFRNDSTN